VHKHCHPRSTKDVAAFASFWKTAIRAKEAAASPAVIAGKKPGKFKSLSPQDKAKEKAVRGLMKLTGKSREVVEAILAQTGPEETGGL